jgi:hypothetical protein
MPYFLCCLAVNLLFDGIYSYCISKAGDWPLLKCDAIIHKSLRFPMSYFDKTPIGLRYRGSPRYESISESISTVSLGYWPTALRPWRSWLPVVLNWRLTLVLLLCTAHRFFDPVPAEKDPQSVF